MIINDLDDYYIVFDTKNRNIELDTLAIRFAASLFLAKKLVFYPSQSLVKSNGLDGTGVHCGGDDVYAGMQILNRPVKVDDIQI